MDVKAIRPLPGVLGNQRVHTRTLLNPTQKRVRAVVFIIEIEPRGQADIDPPRRNQNEIWGT